MRWGESGQGLGREESVGCHRHHSHIEIRLIWREGGREWIVRGCKWKWDGWLWMVSGYGYGRRMRNCGCDWLLVLWCQGLLQPCV